jgi:hypothetical protein
LASVLTSLSKVHTKLRAKSQPVQDQNHGGRQAVQMDDRLEFASMIANRQTMRHVFLEPQPYSPSMSAETGMTAAVAAK